MVMHGFPLRSFASLENGLAEGVPVHLWSPTFDVSTKVRNTPSSCARKVSSSTPFLFTAPGDVNFGFTLSLTLFRGAGLTYTCTASWLSSENELPEPVHDPAATPQQNL